MTTRRTLVQGAVGTMALAPLLRPARLLAQEATPSPAEGGMPPLPEGCTLLAGGLLNPRYLAIAEDGSLYVTEAGFGGEEDIYFAPGEGEAEATPEGGTPMAAEPMGTRGGGGRVSRIDPDGTVTTVADGLASYLFGGIEAIGPAGIVLAGGKVWITVGGPGEVPEGHVPLPTEGHVVSIDEATGEVTPVADILAYEIANNPGGFAVDSDLYGMSLGEDGLLHVADAGGNAVYTVDPESGEIAVQAVIPGIPVPADQAPPGGNPGREGANELDPVPTSTASAPGQGTYVSLLSGGPFPPGAAKIQLIDADGAVTDVAGGLTMATDVKVGPDGLLYAVQISLDFLQEVPAPGSVVRILEDGSLEPVVEGLLFPNGIAFDAEGNLFIAAGTVTPPGADPIGMVVRCDGVAAP